MSPLEIKFLVMRKFGTITACAMKLGCYREELSMCIRQVRVYSHLRQKLADELGMPVEQLFGLNKRREAA
ncbi:MAG: hypothetical protein ACRD9R_13330 [Pyrinomonadaceae bacterium]